MAVAVVVRKWGNSFGVVLPQELVRKQCLKIDDEVLVEVVKAADLTKLFGSLKRGREGEGQVFKDAVRKGWRV